MKKSIKNPLFQMGTFDSSEARIRSFQFLKNKQLEYCIRADKDYHGHDQVAVFIGDKAEKTQMELFMSIDETEQFAKRLLAIAKKLRAENEAKQARTPESSRLASNTK